MGATSVTGVGQGGSCKATTTALAIWANGPQILLSGYVETEDVPTSPPTAEGTVIFPIAFEGGSENYIVIITSLNAGNAYVIDMAETSGNFSGFTVTSEEEGSIMYMVVNVGIRADVITC